MIRRFSFLIALLAFGILGSYVFQSSWHKPLAAIESAQEFELVSTKFCVIGVQTNFQSIEIDSGALPKGSSGRLIDQENRLKQGDCLSALLQLSPARPLERFAFHAKLKQVEGAIANSSELQLVLNMRNFLSNVSGDPKNLVSGLAVGIDSGLSESFQENMKTTGLTHLTAVSGANCAIVLGMVWLLLRLLGVGRGVRTIISLLALCGYVLLVGWQPSVLRSAFMMSVVFVSLEFGRRIWLPGALIVGSLVLLIVDPWLIFEYGFWLSVMATFGLVILTPKLSELFQKQLPKWLSVTLAATISAQIWCLPILVELQGGFATHSIVANLLVEPMVPLVTVLGLLAAILGPFIPGLASLLLTIAAIPASWIVWVANSLAQAPAGLLPIPDGGVGFALTAAFAVFITIAINRQRFRFVFLALLLGGLWFGSLGGIAIRSLGFNLSNWSILACDVEQGDALVLRSENQVAVVDVGKDPQLIDGCLDQQGIEHVELLVLTHFDQDHVGGLTGLLNGRSVSKALISAFPDERPDAIKMVETLNRLNLELVVAPENLTGRLGEFTWNVISSPGSSGATANEASLGMKFESTSMVIYTLADMNERAQDRVLAKAQGSNKPTVVKVSHHGSADQSATFYQQIDADVALISVGRGNSYGHPTKRALQLLAQSGSKVFRTDLEGAVALGVSNGVIEVMSSGGR
ncbi:MAG: hypothetical protein RLZZ380_18 [Actinomycetota bacterium]